tara:strand:+ start:469 stop:1098 length:630 start_codon:yes stop_codon:yes gene_type:complete
MANYIKIPLAVNPARSFAAAITIAPGRLSGGGTIASGTASPATATTVSPVGASGATFTGVATGTAIGDMTLTISAAGEGYKVGDVITVAPQAGGGQTTWSADIVFTVTAADLVTVEGSDLNSYQLIPVDTISFVKPISATAAEMVTNLRDQGLARSTKWTVTVDDVPASTKEQLAADLAEAINKASQAENSIPTVSFYNDAEVLTVVYS